MASAGRSRQSVTPRRRERSRFPPAPVSSSAHAGTNSAPCASHPRAFAAHDRDMRPLACLFLPVFTAVVCWSSWDLAGLVSDWASGGAPNRGLLLKRAEEE